jgi:prepilin-type N-terminal cleavage/methylation domain-containing protein
VSPLSPRPVRDGGFTLTEVLVAVAIFAVLSTMLFSLVGTSLSLFRDGERSRELYEVGPGILDSIAEDLRGLASGGLRTERSADLLFVLDRDEEKRTRLRFVRTLGRDAADGQFRTAGTGAKPTEVIDLRSDALAAEERRLRATGGFVEVAYAFRPMLDEAGKAIPGTLELVKGIRSPIGGNDSLFAADFDASVAGGLALFPIVDGILHFEAACWGPETRSWDASAQSGGAESVWDSSRGRLRDFRWYAGEASEKDPRDDVFPRRVRLSLVLDRPGDRAAGTFLSRALGSGESTLNADDAKRLPAAGDPEPWIKVGSEWIRVGARGAGNEVRLVERGGRGTLAERHEPGSPIRVGIAFESVIEISSPREPETR